MRLVKLVELVKTLSKLVYVNLANLVKACEDRNSRIKDDCEPRNSCRTNDTSGGEQHLKSITVCHRFPGFEKHLRKINLSLWL